MQNIQGLQAYLNIIETFQNIIFQIQKMFAENFLEFFSTIKKYKWLVMNLNKVLEKSLSCVIILDIRFE